MDISGKASRTVSECAGDKMGDVHRYRWRLVESECSRGASDLLMLLR